TFMEISAEQLPDGLGLVFVISCDEERVAVALTNRQRGTARELPGAVLNRDDARRFLDRIFQFRLEIPPFPKQDMRVFATERLRKEMPEIASALSFRGLALEEIIDCTIHVGVQSPRKALQILNAFSQSWWLACQREREGAGTDRPGGLNESAVTGHPMVLGAICVLKVDFPDFYADLQREPSLITHFIDVFIRGKNLQDVPEAIGKVLSNYCDSEVHGLKSDYHSLRQFLSSLAEIRWPSSLQPFLLLSQDPITRRLGDRGPRLYDALVSGDHFGVLRELGRDKDSRLLTREDVRFLKETEEDLRRESSARRNNASAVVAQLAPRFSKEDAPTLLNPLARRLAESPELRWRVGVSRIGDVLGSANPENRRDVAEKLVEDLLKTSGDLTFRLQSGESSSLDEAIEIVKAACSLILSVKDSDSLSAYHEGLLVDWLVIRRVPVNGREYRLPFNDLERWLSEHEASLLMAMGWRYTELVLEQFNGELSQGIDIQKIIDRSRIVFERFRDAGEESRAKLWQQLSEYVRVTEIQVVRLAWEQMSYHTRLSESSALTGFVDRFAQRLQLASETEEWTSDWEEGSTVLLHMLAERGPDLASQADGSLVALAESWSKSDSKANLANRLLDIIREAKKSVGNQIILRWVDRILEDLARPNIDWLSTHFVDALDDQQESLVVDHLRLVSGSNEVSDAQSERYVRFMRNMSDDGLASQSMNQHVSQIMQNIISRSAASPSYVRSVFPAIPRLLRHGEPAVAGEMINSVFLNSKSNLELFGWLHDHMIGYWPAESDSVSYNRTRLFEDAITTLEQFPNENASASILRSVRSMARCNAVPRSNGQRIVDASCNLWAYKPDEVIQTFQEFTEVPSIGVIASLGNVINTQANGDVVRLESVWRLLASRMT
ncbi:MAG: KAP family NTPase, partial [Thaumarchaeota archaeon]|nr:KAP family NTPase [Nitrososphaerota archaeon]